MRMKWFHEFLLWVQAAFLALWHTVSPPPAPSSSTSRRSSIMSTVFLSHPSAPSFIQYLDYSTSRKFPWERDNLALQQLEQGESQVDVNSDPSMSASPRIDIPRIVLSGTSEEIVLLGFPRRAHRKHGKTPLKKDPIVSLDFRPDVNELAKRRLGGGPPTVPSSIPAEMFLPVVTVSSVDDITMEDPTDTPSPTLLSPWWTPDAAATLLRWCTPEMPREAARRRRAQGVTSDMHSFWTDALSVLDHHAPSADVCAATESLSSHGMTASPGISFNLNHGIESEAAFNHKNQHGVDVDEVRRKPFATSSVTKKITRHATPILGTLTEDDEEEEVESIHAPSSLEILATDIPVCQPQSSTAASKHKRNRAATMIQPPALVTALVAAASLPAVVLALDDAIASESQTSWTDGAGSTESSPVSQASFSFEDISTPSSPGTEDSSFDDSHQAICKEDRDQDHSEVNGNNLQDGQINEDSYSFDNVRSRRVPVFGGIPYKKDTTAPLGSAAMSTTPMKDLSAAHTEALERLKASVMSSQPVPVKRISVIRPLVLPVRLAQRDASSGCADSGLAVVDAMGGPDAHCSSGTVLPPSNEPSHPASICVSKTEPRPDPDLGDKRDSSAEDRLNALLDLFSDFNFDNPGSESTSTDLTGSSSSPRRNQSWYESHEAGDNVSWGIAV